MLSRDLPRSPAISAVAGLAVARRLLYVCEERQVQVLTLVGEPRAILPIHAADGLCGIVSDTRRVFVSDLNLHKVREASTPPHRRPGSPPFTRAWPSPPG